MFLNFLAVLLKILFYLSMYILSIQNIVNYLRLLTRINDIIYRLLFVINIAILYC